MYFNPDPNKQANEVTFSSKSKVHSHPPLTFINNDLKKYPHQKHLGIILDLKLDFNIHVDNEIQKTASQCSKKALLTICKSFIRPHLDYGDILYDKPGNQNFQNKLEKV